MFLLAAQAMTPNMLADEFDMTRQAVSKHIKVLVECELLHPQKEGREIYYDLNPDKMEELDKWIDQLRLRWETRFDQLDELLKNS